MGSKSRDDPAAHIKYSTNVLIAGSALSAHLGGALLNDRCCPSLFPEKPTFRRRRSLQILDKAG